ncbi:MAG: peptidyl-prolyl cis-trans isomerase, EpsD family [Burkholderiales bacterium]|nr:peptidyl-prolyl cis-trans isomerase, EpsD family [Burkholderiales bacterium]
MNSKRNRSIAILFVLALVGGCGGESTDKPASQTAAKVNGDEVTVHQINAELLRVGGGNPPQGANAEAVGKRILEGLIDQTLLVQEAKEAKLDRDPQVLQLLEANRRQILAQAYIDRQAAASPPTPDEIKEFFAKNPDLFERRRVYAFREFLFERANFTDALRDQLNEAKSPADVSKILNAAGIRYRETNSRRPAEALPIEALPRIAKMNKGDTLAFTDQNLANVLMLIDYAEQPVALERATPAIQQFLVNQKKRELAQTKVKDLRAKGKIEYVGNYAKVEADAKSAEVKPNTAATAPAEAKKDDHVEKGLQGLRR